MTRTLISQESVHGYQNEKGRRDVLFNLTRDKRLWASEYSEIDDTGLQLARNIHLDFRALLPTAWCYWQPFDGKGWGLLASDMPSASIQQVNPKYFVLAQYTRHIRPGMTILCTDDLETIAANDSKARKLVIIVHNLGDQPQARTYDLAKFTVPDGLMTRWITEPLGRTRYKESKDVVIKDQRLTLVLPPHSIQTLEVNGTIAQVSP